MIDEFPVRNALLMLLGFTVSCLPLVVLYVI